jgi:CheY-like chemotaxis protein
MSRKKILLVDDSNTVLLLHRIALQPSGHQLLVARNGREAVDKALTERPDLILMDVVMPELNGLEACKLLRTREETRAVPIILVTTRGEPFNIQAGYEAGCNEYITKPYEQAELLAKVQHFLSE